MKITFTTLLSISLLFLCVFTLSCKNSAAETTAENATEKDNVQKSAIFLEPQEFIAGMQKGKAVILDVRYPAEFEEGHIEGAMNINFFDTTFKSQLLSLPKNKDYYIYCKNDTRSQRAAEFMMFNEYPEVYVLKGGWEAYQAVQ